MQKDNNFKIAEFSIYSEKLNDWNDVILVFDKYFPYEVVEQTEHNLRLHILIYGNEDLRIIQTLAKQIYSKIMPFGRERVVIID